MIASLYKQAQGKACIKRILADTILRGKSLFDEERNPQVEAVEKIYGGIANQYFLKTPNSSR